MDKILKIKNLTTVFNTKAGILKAVDNVSLSLGRGEMFGLVGESGSGKSAACRSIIQLIPNPPGRIVSGEIIFEGRDLLKMSPGMIRDIRGREISMIFQDPMSALNPVMTIGGQMMEAFREHQGISKAKARDQAVQLLKLVGLPAPEHRLTDYPHNFSGGMRQRVLIAMAMALKPKILLADEPTTALDVTIQDQILKLIASLQKDFGLSVIIVSHDLGVIAQTCERLAVMYAGQIVEVGSTVQVFKSPRHPYTAALLESIPRPDTSVRRLKTISGSPPFLIQVPQGCRFHPRCPHMDKDCLQAAYDLREAGPGRYSACIKDGLPNDDQ